MSQEAKPTARRAHRERRWSRHPSPCYFFRGDVQSPLLLLLVVLLLAFRRRIAIAATVVVAAAAAAAAAAIASS